jgi:hypothetical protein
VTDGGVQLDGFALTAPAMGGAIEPEWLPAYG